jgi:multiple sugar transport system ATP-binding protein
MASLALHELTKVFGNDVAAVSGVELDVADGEFLVLVGPSGCGKSTLLRLIAGFERPTEGSVWIGDCDVTAVRPRERDIAMVFQSYALYPHMTVRGNLEFGMRRRREPAARIAAQTARAAEILELDGLLDRLPDTLSGGQRQRVAIGRAMVREPAVYLMDEPLSNLDAKLRVSMRSELARLHASLGVTTAYVTHDQTEAMTLGQRVCVLDRGVVQQVGTPRELYEQPRNLFVAGFIGSPAMNFVAAEVDDGALRHGPLRLPIDTRLAAALDGRREVLVGIRPCDFRLAGEPDAQTAGIAARVCPDHLEYHGAEQAIGFSLAAGERLIALADARAPLALGRPLALCVDPEHVHVFDAADGRALRP